MIHLIYNKVRRIILKKTLNKRKLSVVLAVLLLATSVLAGCSSNKANGGNSSPSQDVVQEQSKEDSQYPITVTDQIGRTVTIEEPVDSIVSSYYISTAITIALGKEDNLTGIEMKADTRELYKLAAPQLLDLPAVGSGKGVNIEEIANIKPDVVIIPKKLQDSVEQLETLKIPVIVIDPETLDDYMECVTLLGNVFGEEERANQLLTYYIEKMDAVSEMTKDLESKPAVYLGAGSSYLSTCTSKMYQNDLIAMAGGTNVSAELEDGYWAEVSAEHLLSWNPEYIFAVSYAEYTLEDIKNDKALQTVDAVKEGNVFLFPSEIEPWDYPTPSSILGVLWLTHVLHEDLYTEEAYITEAKEFYRTFFDIDVTEAQLGL